MYQLFNQHGVYLNKYYPDGGEGGRCIHDVEYVEERSLLCFSCTDQTIFIVLEKHDGQSHEPKGYQCLAKIIHNVLHRKLRWSPQAQRLFSASTTDVLYVWDLDKRELAGTLPSGGQLLMEVIMLPDKRLMATSGLDGKIRLWTEESLRPKGVLEGHKRGQFFSVSIGSYP